MDRLKLDTELSALDADFDRETGIIENKIRDRRITIIRINTRNETEVAELKADIYMLEKERADLKAIYSRKRAELQKSYDDARTARLETEE